MSNEHGKKQLFVRLSEDLHKAIKIFCAQKGITLQQLVEKILKETLEKQESAE